VADPRPRRPLGLFVGIDAGGSKTLARAFSVGGERVFETETGPMDLPSLGQAECSRRLTVLRQHLEASLPVGTEVERVVLGAPGFGEVKRWTQAWEEVAASALAGWRPSVHNDVRLAFYAAFPAGQGILVLAGTGSMAWGGSDHREARSGGWGHWFGDEGSAFYLGRKALQAAAAASDGRGPATVLTTSILQATGAPDLWTAVEGLVVEPATYRSKVALLAKAVDRAAAEGDVVAGGIVDAAGRHLALHADAVNRELGGNGLRVARAGGAFNSTGLTQQFDRHLAELGLPPSEATAPDPVAGAFVLARRETGPES